MLVPTSTAQSQIKCAKNSLRYRRHNWPGVAPLFQFPPEIRKIIHTANAVESLNMSLRKAVKTRGAFPAEAALKVIYLALKNLAAKWKAVLVWKEPLNPFALLWEDRFPHSHSREGCQQAY